MQLRAKHKHLMITMAYFHIFDSFFFVTGCKFPSHWSGSWFQSGVQGMVVVNGTNISSKGQCMQADGEKFIIQEQ